jgi:hypothetical protein
VKNQICPDLSPRSAPISARDLPRSLPRYLPHVVPWYLLLVGARYLPQWHIGIYLILLGNYRSAPPIGIYHSSQPGIYRNGSRHHGFDRPDSILVPTNDNALLYSCPLMRPTVRLDCPNAALVRHESAGGPIDPPSRAVRQPTTWTPLGHPLDTRDTSLVRNLAVQSARPGLFGPYRLSSTPLDTLRQVGHCPGHFST